MLSGNLQGQFLKMICRMIGARRVLEIGTYTGYAAISMAAGLEEGGVLHTIDVNDELEDFTRCYMEKSGLQERIVFHVGDVAIVGVDGGFYTLDELQHPDGKGILTKPNGVFIETEWRNGIIYGRFKSEAKRS